MSGQRFALEINLGNDAMSTPQDVAEAIRRVADRVDGLGDLSGGIRDLNGNTVGRYGFHDEEA